MAGDSVPVVGDGTNPTQVLPAQTGLVNNETGEPLGPILPTEVQVDNLGEQQELGCEEEGESSHAGDQTGRGTDAVELAEPSMREVLEYATIEGARANGLESKTGTLTPGKQADVILLRTDRINVTPFNDPVAAVVTSMDTGNVDTVLIAGRVMKRHGRLLHVDWQAVKRLALESRDHVIEKSGFRLPGI